MAFFDEIGKKISVTGKGAVQQAKNYTEMSRLKGLVAENRKRIESLYCEIGKDYYEKHREDLTAENRDRMEAIQSFYEQIGQWEEQIKEIRESVRCPQCGAMVPASSRFCNECGYEMGSEARENVPAGEVCPSCGTPISRDMKFCVSCGAKLSFEEPDAATEEELDAGRRCPVCGSPVDESMLFCVSCGTRLEPVTPTAGADGTQAPPPATQITT